jgi:hypothetical protein
MTVPLKQFPPSTVVRTPQVFRSRNRCRRYRRIRKSLKGSFAARGTFKNLRRNALSLRMLGQLLREAVTSPGEGHLHICNGAFTELVRYHGLSPCYDIHAGQTARDRLFDSRRYDRSF